jgi:hypothetical protein
VTNPRQVYHGDATFQAYITDIHALGLPVTEGLTFASSFY